MLFNGVLFRFKSKNEFVLKVYKVGYLNKKRLPHGK